MKTKLIPKLSGKPIANAISTKKARELYQRLPPRVRRSILTVAFPNYKFRYRKGYFEIVEDKDAPKRNADGSFLLPFHPPVRESGKVIVELKSVRPH